MHCVPNYIVAHFAYQIQSAGTLCVLKLVFAKVKYVGPNVQYRAIQTIQCQRRQSAIMRHSREIARNFQLRSVHIILFVASMYHMPPWLLNYYGLYFCIKWTVYCLYKQSIYKSSALSEINSRHRFFVHACHFLRIYEVTQQLL